MAYNYKNRREYYLKNRKTILRKKKEYYQKNKTALKGKMRIYGKKWYRDNIEKIRKRHREYYKNNKKKSSEYHKILYLEKKDEILKKSREYYRKNKEAVDLRHRKYNIENKEKLQAYKGNWQKIQRKINPNWRLNENMGRAIWNSLKNKKAGEKWERFVEYNLDQLIKHLEKKFDKRMNWGNYGNYWAVDHIKPKSLFAYSSPDGVEFKQCWSLKNLQPLEKIENIKKRNHYIGN